MAKPVTMPQLGESVTEGTITRWLKAEGDEVEIDEPLAEVDTDKVNAELPSPVAGTIEKFLVSEGATVDVGTEIVTCRRRRRFPRHRRPATGERRRRPPPRKSSPPRTPRPSPSRTGRDPASRVSSRSGGNGRGEIEDAETLRLTRSSPVVRRLAEEHDVEIAEIPGTGTGGRVTRKDIEGYIEEQEEREAEREEPAPRERRETASSPSRSRTRARVRGRPGRGSDGHPAGHRQPHVREQTRGPARLDDGRGGRERARRPARAGEGRVRRA